MIYPHMSGYFAEIFMSFTTVLGMMVPLLAVAWVPLWQKPKKPMRMESVPIIIEIHQCLMLPVMCCRMLDIILLSCLIVGSLREDCDLYSRRGGKSTKKTLIMSEVTTIENPVGQLARRDSQNEKE